MCKKQAKFILAAIWLLIQSSSVVAQLAASKPILLNSGIIRTNNNTEAWAVDQAKFPVQVLAQFQQLPGEQEQNLLRQHGMLLQQYIPEQAYIAVMSRKIDATILRNAGVIFISGVAAEWKTGTALRNLLPTAHNDVEVNVHSLSRPADNPS